MKNHKLVANAFLENPEKKLCVDHINGDKTNNHVTNLRWATVSENSQNKKIQSNNTSGIVGVYFHKNSQKWKANITVNKKVKCLGSFENIDNAIKARNDAEILHFGEFRRV